MSHDFNSKPQSILARHLRCFWLLSLLAGSIVISWNALVQTFHLALSNEAHTHILLILPLTGALALTQKRIDVTSDQLRKSRGYLLLTAACILAAIAAWTNFKYTGGLPLSLGMFALVTWWIGSLIACYGLDSLRAHQFSILFLYWLVPIPDFALEKIISALQILSAYATRFLLVVGRIPVTQDGTLLSMPGFDVDVAPQCSSIRSSLMLIITTMVLAHLFLRSWQRKTILIAAAVPMAALKNGIRISTLVAIGTRYDPGIFDSDLHHRGGIVFFLISVMMTFALLWIMRRTEEAGHANAEGRGKHQLMQPRS